MQGLYFLVMLIGVGWLCAWTVLPPERARRGWWPFDMRDDAGDAAFAPVPATPRRGWRGEAAGRGIGGPEAAPPADLQHALPQPRSAQSWRVRGKPAAAPRRRRRR